MPKMARSVRMDRLFMVDDFLIRSFMRRIMKYVVSRVVLSLSERVLKSLFCVTHFVSHLSHCCAIVQLYQ